MADSERDDRPTRERLIDAAIESIEADGEVGVRVETAAARADVSKASIYHFFHDRDGLVVAAQAERYRRALRQGMDLQTSRVRACADREDFKGLVRSWMSTVFSPEGVARRRVRIDVLGSAVARPNLRAEVAATDRQVCRELAELLMIAHDRGWIAMPFDLEAASMWWFGMLNGRFLVENEYDPETLERWDQVATAATMVMVFGEI